MNSDTNILQIEEIAPKFEEQQQRLKNASSLFVSNFIETVF